MQRKLELAKLNCSTMSSFLRWSRAWSPRKLGRCRAQQVAMRATNNLRRHAWQLNAFDPIPSNDGAWLVYASLM